MVVDTVEVALELQEEVQRIRQGRERRRSRRGGGGHDVEPSDGLRLGETEEFAGFADEETAQPLVRKARANAAVIKGMDEDTIWERLMDPNAKDFDEFEERIGASDEEDDDVTGGANELERRVRNGLVGLVWTKTTKMMKNRYQRRCQQQPPPPPK